MEQWSDFVKANIGMVVLLFLVLVMLGFMLHVSHDQADTSMLSWSREQTSLVLGGLLGLITGRQIATKEKPQDPPQEQ